MTYLSYLQYLSFSLIVTSWVRIESFQTCLRTLCRYSQFPLCSHIYLVFKSIDKRGESIIKGFVTFSSIRVSRKRRTTFNKRKVEKWKLKKKTSLLLSSVLDLHYTGGWALEEITPKVKNGWGMTEEGCCCRGSTYVAVLFFLYFVHIIKNTKEFLFNLWHRSNVTTWLSRHSLH